jgi:hypothetical protein
VQTIVSHGTPRARKRRAPRRTTSEAVGTPKPKPAEHYVRMKRAIYRVWRDEAGELQHERT